jgi:signal transduction histidine kinase/ActR/RegA family two-component response regulator
VTVTTPGRDELVLVLLPTSKDAERTCAALSGVGIACLSCKDLADLCRAIAVGAGAALLTEEVVAGDRSGCLATTLHDQPTWSDLPLVVLAREKAQGREALRESMNVTLVERPLRMRSLVSVLRAALRGRRRQYEVRDHLGERLRAAEALQDQDRRKDEFLALLAHELRNPLAPLRNGLQVMRLAANDTNAVAQARAMMDRQLEHMVRLIDDLLDIARISQNKMELRRSRVLLADVVSSAVETARPAIEAAGHELTLSLPQRSLFLDADLTRLAQVFSNLLTNSARYTDRGGRIWLSAERQGSEVIVVVRDTGIGIPADALPRIFDMFSQVDRSIERSTGGLGIGLALVKGLVEMHNGTVAAMSDGPGKGSAFTVKLPALANQTEPVAAVPSGNGHTTAGPRRRILVVDDNRDSARSMALMLELLGNDVRSAHDGVEAVEAAEAFCPQVILMDVGMPRLNGLDATRRIRAQQWGRSVVVIALTGWGKEDDKVRSQQAGCDGHLVKPVNLADLEKLLAELMYEKIGRK